MSEANGNGRILVVDDEPSIVDAVATALRYEGFEVEEGDRPRRARRRRGVRARPGRARLDAAGHRRDRGRPAPAGARLQDGDPLPHREGRGRGQGRGTARRRRRLRHEAVQPRRDRRARAGDAAPDEAATCPATFCASPMSRSTRTGTRFFRGDTPIDLTATEFNLLRFFMLNPRRVLSKSQILQNVWHYDFGGNRTSSRRTSATSAASSTRRPAADPDGAPGRLHARGGASRCSRGSRCAPG